VTGEPIPQREPEPSLHRGLGLLQAVSLNVSNMVGIGPFITIPIFLERMGGPQAMIAWVIAAVLIVCDGLVWSELGAAFPSSGGTYHYLREAYRNVPPLGRVLPFLFIWQFLITGTLELASGYLGSMMYLEYVFPQLTGSLSQLGIADAKPWICAATAIAVTLLLSRRITVVGWLSVAFFSGAMITVALVIVSGLKHFDRSLITFPENAFELSPAWIIGLAASMRIAIYDYLGYYNVCHLGDEVKSPEKTIPRAILISIGLVAAIYLTMNVCIIGVVPWQDAMASKNIAATFMEKLYGRNIAVIFTAMVLWTSLACVFAMTLGYSRIPFAAARGGDFFPVFARLHPRHGFPAVALWAIGMISAAFCFFPLDLIVSSAVTVRILVEFLAQIAGLQVLRKTRPDVRLPFRMWFYPLPSLLAAAGWIFLLVVEDRDLGYKPLVIALAVNMSGLIAFWVWKSLAKPPAERSVP
jgi:amino acid transporter